MKNVLVELNESSAVIRGITSEKCWFDYQSTGWNTSNI